MSPGYLIGLQMKKGPSRLPKFSYSQVGLFPVRGMARVWAGGMTRLVFVAGPCTIISIHYGSVSNAYVSPTAFCLHAFLLIQMAAGMCRASSWPRLPLMRQVATYQNDEFAGMSFTGACSNARWLQIAVGGIAKKVEEASVIAALGTEVAIALAGSESGRLSCMQGPSQLRHQAGWGGTCVRLAEAPNSSVL